MNIPPSKQKQKCHLKNTLSGVVHNTRQSQFQQVGLTRYGKGIWNWKHLRHLFDMDTSIYILYGVKCIENEIDSNLTCEYRDNKSSTVQKATHDANGSKTEAWSQASELRY